MALRMDRSELYARINARCGAMMDAGLMSEAKNLRDRGLATTLPALRAIGCQECFSVLEGVMTVERAVALLQQGSRRYAKRQMTWLRGQKELRWVEAADATAAVRTISRIIREKGCGRPN